MNTYVFGKHDSGKTPTRKTSLRGIFIMEFIGKITARNTSQLTSSRFSNMPWYKFQQFLEHCTLSIWWSAPFLVVAYYLGIYALLATCCLEYCDPLSKCTPSLTWFSQVSRCALSKHDRPSLMVCPLQACVPLSNGVPSLLQKLLFLSSLHSKFMSTQGMPFSPPSLALASSLG